MEKLRSQASWIQLDVEVEGVSNDPGVFAFVVSKSGNHFAVFTSNDGHLLDVGHSSCVATRESYAKGDDSHSHIAIFLALPLPLLNSKQSSRCSSGSVNLSHGMPTGR